MYLIVPNQITFPCKPFATHCTQMQSWLVIGWVLSNIIAISFNLQLKGHYNAGTWLVIMSTLSLHQKRTKIDINVCQAKANNDLVL